MSKSFSISNSKAAPVFQHEGSKTNETETEGKTWQMDEQVTLQLVNISLQLLDTFPPFT